eukprot:RCo029126
MEASAMSSGLAVEVGDGPRSLAEVLVELQGCSPRDSPQGSPTGTTALAKTGCDPLLNLHRRLRRASEHTDWEALSREVQSVIRGLNLVTEDMPEEVVASSPK